tara:strand:+ start:1179 stop:2873 length:1695 start_codon:yes stop_codon:yes gene_type:complete
MISVSGKKWQEIKVDNKLVEKFQQDHNFSKIVSQLIVSRNFDKDEIHLIKNNLKISNIFQHKPDFINSVKLIQDAIINKEKICILGDYDVDGSVATSLFIKFFEHLKNPYFYYIPDREKDGYGASKKLFKKLIRKKPNLIIMVDCGSTSVEAIDFLNENKIKSLIIDHHEIYKPYPKANAIINPKKDNGYNEYNYLCATALTFFFLEILSDKLKSKINLKKNLIYVLLATVCDVMPLRKLNRLISINALNEFNLNDNPLFIRIYHLINKKNKININDLGYLVGPILNAGGRLGKSNYATELLSTNNIEIIDKKAVELFNLNKKRREIETKILNSIDFKKIEKKSKDLIIYYNSNINEGLIGIIASRLKDHFNKPSIVITNSNNLLKGSARSVLNYNIGRAIKNSLDKNLIINGGGHNMAAGFSLEKKNLLNFEKFITKDYLSKNIRSDDVYKYDSELSTIGFNKEFYNDIKQIGPFGTGNPEPIFLLKKLKVIKSTIIENKHISCILKSKIGFLIKSISFNSLNNEIGRNLLNNKKYFNVIGEINENFWNNKKTLQLIIKDLIV